MNDLREFNAELTNTFKEIDELNRVNNLLKRTLIHLIVEAGGKLKYGYEVSDEVGKLIEEGWEVSIGTGIIDISLLENGRYKVYGQ